MNAKFVYFLCIIIPAVAVVAVFSSIDDKVISAVTTAPMSADISAIVLPQIEVGHQVEPPSAEPTRILSREQARQLNGNGANNQTQEQAFAEFVEQNYIVVPGVDLGPYGSGGRYEILWHVWSPRVLAFLLIVSVLLLWPAAHVKIKRHEVDTNYRLEVEKARLAALRDSPHPIVTNRYVSGALHTKDGREVTDKVAKTFVANFMNVGLALDDWIDADHLSESEIKSVLDLLVERHLVTPVVNGVAEWRSDDIKIRDITRALGLNNGQHSLA